MRTLISIAIVTLLGATAAAKDPKIAYVDLSRALNEVNDGKSAKAKLKKDFEKKQKTLDSAQKKLKAKKDEFDKKRGMMKPDVLAQKQEELQREFLELQQTYMKLQQELVEKEAELTQGIAGKLKKVIERIGDRDAYDLVLNIGDTVLFYKRHLDVTDQVVQEYNKQYGKK